MKQVSDRKKIREMGADELDKWLRHHIKIDNHWSLEDYKLYQTALKQFKELTNKNWK